MNRGKYIVVTNNPLVWEKLHTTREMIYKETTFEGLLVELRDRIHQGHMLLTHPLSGSVKPNETPTVSTLEITPGKIPPLPSTFTRGSITSFTGVILTDSPGFAMSNDALLIFSSSRATALTASSDTYRIPSSILTQMRTEYP